MLLPAAELQDDFIRYANSKFNELKQSPEAKAKKRTANAASKTTKRKKTALEKYTADNIAFVELHAAGAAGASLVAAQ